MWAGEGFSNGSPSIRDLRMFSWRWANLGAKQAAKEVGRRPIGLFASVLESSMIPLVHERFRGKTRGGAHVESTLFILFVADAFRSPSAIQQAFH